MNKAIEDVIWEAARLNVPAEALGRERLTEAIIARSRRYTSERGALLLEAADPDADLAARAVFFSVCDAPKLAVPLRELAGRGFLPPGPRQVLDLGAGSGAMTLGLSTERAEPLEVTAVDLDDDALHLFETTAELLEQKGLVKHLSLVTEALGVTEFPIAQDRYDLILAGSLLNELEPDERERIVSSALRGLRPDGFLILVEPALRETSRDLHLLRDFVLSRGLGHVFAPCTRTQAPCPALADPRDWCHEDRPINLPPRAAELGARTGLREHGLKFSYLVLGREPRSLVDAGSALAWRVVSQSRNLKGKRECFLCSERGRVRMTLLKRHRSEANHPFERADRGDVLLIDQSVDDRLLADTRVLRHRPTGD